MSNPLLVVDFSVMNDFLWLKVSQYLSSFPDHDIVIVTISNAQDVSSYTVASAGQRELFYCWIKFVPGDKKDQTNKQVKHEWVLFLQYIYTTQNY